MAFPPAPGSRRAGYQGETGYPSMLEKETDRTRRCHLAGRRSGRIRWCGGAVSFWGRRPRCFAVPEGGERTEGPWQDRDDRVHGVEWWTSPFVVATMLKRYRRRGKRALCFSKKRRSEKR